jgi:hypothetical protein
MQSRNTKCVGGTKQKTRKSSIIHKKTCNICGKIHNITMKKKRGVEKQKGG